MKLKIGFTSDLHMGIGTWGRINPSTGVNTMVEKFVSELEKTLDRLIERKIHIWIIPGDITHIRTPNNYVRAAFTRIMQRAREAGITVYVMLGNHDQQVGIGTKNNLSELAQLKIKGLTIIEQSRMITYSYGASAKDDTGGIENVIQIGFLPWQKNAKDIVDDAKRIISEIDPKYPAILVGHFSVEGAEVGTEKLFELYGDTVIPSMALKDKKVQYTFLGHIHKRQLLKKFGSMMYIGSMERIDFSERNDSKGSTLFTIDCKTKEFDLDFIEGTPQEYVQFDVNLKKEKLKDVDFSKSKGAVVKVKIECTDEQRKLLDYEYLHEQLKDAIYVAEPKFEIEKDDERVRDKKVVKDLEITEALKIWLDKQDLTPEMKKEVLKEGRKFLEEVA